jgi:PAS domain S-box-containing protein
MLRQRNISEEYTLAHWPNIVTLLAGAVASTLGLVVLIGWYTHNTALLQVLPGFVAMQYNTALAFLLSGAGLLSAIFSKSRAGAVLGAVVAAIGLLTLAQYIFGIDIGIDQLLMQAYNVGQTAVFAPGRMALNSAVCFTLTGAALIGMAVGGVRLRQRALVLGVLGSLIIALAAVPFFGYLTGVASAYGWGSLTRMAVHTAVGFMVMGSGIVAFAWQADGSGKRGAPAWLPVLVTIGTVMATLLLWQALVSEQRTQTQRLVQREATVIKNQIADRMQFRILVLTRLAARWDIYGKPTQQVWESDAALLVDPGTVNRAIQWVDPSFHVRWIASSDASRSDQDKDLSVNPQIRAALETARDQHTTVVTSGDNLPDGSKTILVTVPTFQGEQFDGFVIGVFQTEQLFNTLIGDEIERGYSIAVHNGDYAVYSSHEGDREYYTELREEADIALPGTTWSIQVWPSQKLIAQTESPFPGVVLIAGLAVALLLGLAMYLAQTARSRTKQAEAANLELAREIIEREQIEEDLKRSQIQLTEAQKTAHMGSWEWDIATGKVTWSEELYRIFGFEAGQFEPTYQAYLAQIHPDDRDSVIQAIGTAIQELGTFSHDLRAVRPDGTPWISHAQGRVIADDNGKPAMMVGIAQDITERKQAEDKISELNRELERRVEERTAQLQATNQELAAQIVEREQAEEVLAASEAELRALFAAMTDVVLVLDRQGRYLQIAPTNPNLLYKPPAELLGRTVHEVLPPADADNILRDIHLALQNQEPVPVEYSLSIEGTVFWFDGTVSPMGQDKVFWLARDITERKQVEDTLRESEENFRLMFENNPLPMWVYDQETLAFLEVNEAAIARYGYSRYEFRSMKITDIRPASDVPSLLENRASERPALQFSNQRRHLLKDGRIIDVEITSHTFSFDGRPAVLVVAEDITERKRAEQVLRQSEERFRLLIEGVKDYAIFMLDPSGRVASWNEGAERIKGYSAEEIIGQHFSRFYTEEDVQGGKPDHELKVAVAEGRYEEEGWRVRKDGSRFWVNVVITAVHDEGGQLRGFSKVSRDITERKLAAERTAFLVEASTTLASSLEYEETLTRVARIAVPRIADWCNVDILDKDGQVQRVALAHSDPAKEEVAYEYLRRYPSRQDSDAGVNLALRTLEPILIPNIDDAMIKASAQNPEQLEFLRQMQPTSAMIVPLVARDQAVGAITFLTAESGRRYGSEDLVLAEEVARRAATAVENAQLYQQANHARSEAEAAGKALEKLVTELERSNAELQQFAYVASHDLQEPLRMVASYTQLLSRRYKGKLDEAADEFIAYAVDGANRMQTLINDLLAYSRVSTQGKAFEPTDCEDVLNQALANLRVALKESDAVVTHDPLPTVMGDDVQLMQLFQNLIGNAIKFRDEKPPAIHIGVERKVTEREWLICVRDNGIGMDAQYADRIFVIFQRLHSREEYPGTGIGLSVCKKVVERHGGRIWVESRPGEGSTFYFTLPMSDVGSATRTVEPTLASTAI